MYRVVRYTMVIGQRKIICFTVLRESEIGGEDTVVSRQLESEEEGWTWLKNNPLSAWDHYYEGRGR